MPAAWAVLNQSQSPAFQRLLERLARRLGPCLVYTGTPYGNAAGLELRRGPAYDRRGLARRAASWAAFTIGAFFRTMRLPAGVPVLVATNPPVLPQVAWLASLLRRHPYAVLVWDLYPEHIVQMGWMGARHPLVRAWRWLNRMSFLRARAVITIGDRMARAIREQVGGETARLRLDVIPNWADVESIRPLPKEQNPFAVEHRQVGKITVMYSGNLGATHGADVVADVAIALRGHDRFSFLVVGGGIGRARLEKVVGQHGLANVRLLDYQPWQVLPLSLATADVALVSQAPGSEHLSVPSKTYSCLAAGSAILALTAEDSDLGRLVLEHDVGVVCPASDAAAIATELLDLVSSPERFREMRANARRVAEDHFSAGVIAARFEAVLAEAFAGPAGGAARAR